MHTAFNRQGRPKAMSGQTSLPIHGTLAMPPEGVSGHFGIGAPRRRNVANDHALCGAARRHARQQQAQAQLQDQRAEARFQHTWRNRLRLATPPAVSAATSLAALRERVLSRPRL
jgi:hypothetical protein